MLQHARALLPSRADVRSSLCTLGLIVVGAIVLTPLTAQLPMLGWDWYHFFHRYSPDFTIVSQRSAYPPYAVWFIDLLTWMPWRDSLARLNALSLMSVAVCTWQQGGRSGSVILALSTPPLWYLMWVGHPDGLALLGVAVNFIPLALIKPHLTAWAFLRSHRLRLWMGLFITASILLWPDWLLRLGRASMHHETAFGWAVLGWPIVVVGVLMLAGAGDNPYRLMAAGFLISPHLLPYNLAVLAPAIGLVRGPHKIVLWAAAWLTLERIPV